MYCMQRLLKSLWRTSIEGLPDTGLTLYTLETFPRFFCCMYNIPFGTGAGRRKVLLPRVNLNWQELTNQSTGLATGAKRAFQLLFFFANTSHFSRHVFGQVSSLNDDKVYPKFHTRFSNNIRHITKKIELSNVWRRSKLRVFLLIK